MFKLLVLSCVLVSCLAEPFGVRSWLSEARRLHPLGCADRAEGRRACARVNNIDTLAPHGHDCSLFFYCSSEGARPACRKCPAGLHFNPQLQVCDWPANVNCTPRPPRPSRPPRPLPNRTTSYPTTTEDDAAQTDTTIIIEDTTTEASTAEPDTTIIFEDTTT